jgi:hypothetical protein
MQPQIGECRKSAAKVKQRSLNGANEPGKPNNSMTKNLVGAKTNSKDHLEEATIGNPATLLAR